MLELAQSEIERRDPDLHALVWRDFDQAHPLAGVMPLDRPFAGVPLLLKDTPPHHLAGAPTTDGCAPHQDRILASQLETAQPWPGPSDN